jgi:outer membrane murein-binding lipoprotein Lpp
MQRRLIAVAVAVLALVGAHSVQAQTDHPDPQVRDEVNARVDPLIDQRDFKALDAIAAEDRSRDLRTPAGLPMLELFYEAVDGRVGDAEHRSRCASPLFDQIAAWAKADPRSPTAVSLYAMALNDRAWCYRGGDYADKVPGRDWGPFKSYIQQQRDWLDAHKAVGQADPEWYLNMEHVARAQGWSETDFLALVRAGGERYPDYFPIWVSGMAFFNPRWYGDNAKMEAFARMAAQRTAPTEGKAIYARLYWHEFDALQLDNLRTQTDIDWTLMKGAMNDLTARNPNS